MEVLKLFLFKLMCNINLAHHTKRLVTQNCFSMSIVAFSYCVPPVHCHSYTVGKTHSSKHILGTGNPVANKIYSACPETTSCRASTVLVLTGAWSSATHMTSTPLEIQGFGFVHTTICCQLLTHNIL